ncbi:MAG: alpha/beta hydrolase [Caulobacteraceae bacterium]|nr:alpha/beta hydrolase [Caulobacteraceae bacterium]
MGVRAWIGVAFAGLLAFGPMVAEAQVQPVSLEAVADAVDTGDLAALRRVSADQSLIGQLRSSDPDTLIAFHLALAQAYAEAGLKDEAIKAYQDALTAILQFRGQGDISMAAPMEAVARLSDTPAKKAQWLLTAYDLREGVWGRGNGNLKPYLDELNAARVSAGLEPFASRGGEGLPPPPPPPPPPVPGAPPPAPSTDGFREVQVYYATHRAPTGDLTPATFYGGQRAELSFGVAEVSVPNNRNPGTIPRPSIWTLEFRPDPEKHMILNSVTPVTDRDAFFQRVSSVVARSQQKEVFVFIHGYNTSFEGAAIRTAQLAVDMNLDGAPILYSWPSRASLLGYQADTRTVADQALLNEVADFLTDVANRTGATRVHLVAHSMGNRVLERALDVIAARTPNQPPMFNEVVFAAADVGVDEFEATWPRILHTGRRFTLYASQRDRALQISQQVNRMQRVGDARNIIVRDGLQTVDTTAASGGLLGHDDFAGSALADFRAVMWLSLAPEKRCVLETAQAAQGQRYWAFGGGCPEQEFVEDTETVRADGGIDKALAKLDADTAKAALVARAALVRKRERLAAMFGISQPIAGETTSPAAPSPAGAP